MTIHYVLEVSYSVPQTARWTKSFHEKTLDDLKERILKEQTKKSVVSFSAWEYELIYDHKNPLPEADGFNEFYNEKTYSQNYKTPKRTAKVKDYKDKIKDDSNIFKIKYKALSMRKEFEDTEFPLEYYREQSCVYNAKTLKEAKEMLYSHTKSNRYFDVKLYQCREIKIPEMSIASS